MASDGSPRVVVVGDPAVEGLVDHLESNGVSVVQAATLDGTLSAIAGGGVGCVLAPSKLPAAYGTTICGELRVRELDVPFVLCGPSDRDVEELAAAGGVDFVVSTGPTGMAAADLARLAEIEALRYLEGSADDNPWTGFSDVGRDAVDALGGSETVEGYERTDDGRVVVEEAQLARFERDSEMLESLLKNVPASVYFKDLLGRHERVSDWQTFDDQGNWETNAEGKVHPMPPDFVGKTDFDIYPHASIEEAVTDDRRVMMTGEPTKDKIGEARDVWGQERFFSTTKAPRYDDDGNVIGLVGITTNVTDRVHSERELQRQNDRLSEFADVLAHDLRNPLNVARGHLGEIDADGADPNVEAIDTSLARMERLIEEVLTYAREGRSVDDPETVVLSTVAEAAWNGVDTASATLSVESDLSFRADPDRLQRLLENMFRNAVEHGGDTVRVEVGTLQDGTGFYVEDDGPGLPASAEQVFERGFTTRPEGTGFGLSIVHNIASAHGWTVTATGADSDAERDETASATRGEPADASATDAESPAASATGDEPTGAGARFEIRDVSLIPTADPSLPEF